MTRNNRLQLLFCLFLSGGVYGITRSRFVSFHDSLSFLLDAQTGFSLSTNATSHFLYNNILHMLYLFSGNENAVWVLTFFSILSALGTLYFFWHSAFLISNSGIASSAVSLALAFSFSFWQQSLIIEVYTFNACLFSLFVFLVLRIIRNGGSESLLFTGLVLFFMLLTHIQNILAIPAFIWLLWRTDTSPVRKWISAAIACSAFVLLTGLPLYTHTHSLRAVFFENAFQHTAMGFDLAGLGKGIVLALGFALYNLHLFWFPAGTGASSMFREQRAVFFFLIFLFLPWMLFGVKFTVPDNHVFFLSAWMVALWFSSFGLSKILERKPSWGIPAMVASVLIPVGLYFTVTTIALSYPGLQSYHEKKAYKGGVRHLFWPGKNSVQDPLVLADQLKAKGENPDSVEWNYSAALKILEMNNP